jgi:hypothetical protein
MLLLMDSAQDMPCCLHASQHVHTRHVLHIAHRLICIKAQALQHSHLQYSCAAILLSSDARSAAGATTHGAVHQKRASKTETAKLSVHVPRLAGLICSL